MDEKITTWHPAGKQGVNINRDKYEIIKQAIIETLRIQPGLAFNALTAQIEQKIGGSFEGSVGWYVTTVKLDLEARGIIARVGQTSPQQLQLVESDGNDA